jgi:hypothetical protein
MRGVCVPSGDGSAAFDWWKYALSALLVLSGGFCRSSIRLPSLAFGYFLVSI